MSSRVLTVLAEPRLTRRAFACVLAALSVGAFRSAARADEPGFRVIIHPENPFHAIDRDVLSRMFLKEVSRWDDGEAAHPVDLRGDSDTRSKFSESVIRRSIAAVRNYWQQRIFSGRGVPPPEVESDAEAVRYVLKHRGAVGYVSNRADIEKCKVLVVNY